MNIFVKQVIFQDRNIQGQDIQEVQDEQSNEFEESENRSKRRITIKRRVKSLLCNYTRNPQLKIGDMKKRIILEGFQNELTPSVQQCFYFFCQALANARSLKCLDISGMEINPLIAIEIGLGLQKNTSLTELQMGGCKMNSFCLQYLFSSLTNHKTLQTLNLFNNQGFTIEIMYDLSQFLFKGENKIRKIKLTHCNIPNTAMSYFLRNLKNSSSINEIDISMMQFDTEVLTSLGIALEKYIGKKALQSLNISDTNIRDNGLETLAQRVSWSFSKVNLRELNLRRNFITQTGVEHLEKFLRRLSQLQKLNISYNQIIELNCQHLLTRKLYELNLSHNQFSQFPNYFFMNCLILNLANNSISSKGAFQLSSLLSQNPLWQDLNLSNNQIRSQGFNSILFGLRDNNHLKCLNVANNKLDGEAVICFMINHEQVQFQHLDLSFNAIRFKLIFFLLSYIKGGLLQSFRCSYLQSEEIRVENSLFFKQFNEAKAAQEAKVYQFTSFFLNSLDFHGNVGIFPIVVNSLSSYYNKIENLNLSKCIPIQNDDIDQLCQFIKKSTMIKDLNLSNLKLGVLKAQTIKKLSETIQLSSLKNLNLSANRLYRQFRVFAGAVGCNFKLEKLDLSSNCFNNQQSHYIENVLLTYRNLKDVNLSRNRFGYQGIFNINRAMEMQKSIHSLNLSSQLLSADDFIMLSQTLQYERLQTLNLSNNLQTNRTKFFYQSCCNLKQQNLEFSNIYLDSGSIFNLLKIIRIQKKTLKSIQLDHCIFSNNCFIDFSEELINCRKITYMSIINNPTIFQDLNLISHQFCKFKRLQVLKMNSVSVTLCFIEGLKDFLCQNECNIQILDLSQNKLQQEYLDQLNIGISVAPQLQSLFLNKCQLGYLKINGFGVAVGSNPSIRILEIANNFIYDIVNFLDQLVNQKRCNLREINLQENPLSSESLIKLFNKQLDETKIYDQSVSQLQLSQLNLSYCELDSNIFRQITQQTITQRHQFQLQCIRSLSLGNNHLSYHAGKVLKNLIQNSHSIEELHLNNNLIESSGAIQILEGIIENHSLKILDLSFNEIDDYFAAQLEIKLKGVELPKFQFILLRGNRFLKQGVNHLVNVIQKSKDNQVFIDNIWDSIDDAGGQIILSQFSHLGKKYKLNSQSCPQYIKEIIINNSELTDKFCESIALAYPYLSFIEDIDISDNPYITMYGKAYLFLNLFDQKYENHNLQSVYISDSQETRKLFDDGIFRYFVLRFKNYLQPPQTINQKLLLNQTIQIMQNIGPFKSWLIHKVSKLLEYLDSIEPPQFIVSTIFSTVFNKSKLSMQIASILFTTLSFFVTLIQFQKIAFSKYTPIETIYDNFQEQCPDAQAINTEQCRSFSIDDGFDDQFWIIIDIAVVTLIDLIQLRACVNLRQFIKPSYQIVHPKLMQYLEYKYPHQNEIFLSVISAISRFQTFVERYLLYYFILFSNANIKLNLEPYQFTCYHLFIAYLLITIWRYIEQLILLIKHAYEYCIINQEDDIAKYICLFQRKTNYEQYFAISALLVQLCPMEGYQISKSVKINKDFFILFQRLLIFDISHFIIVSLYYMEIHKLFEQRFHSIDPTQGQILTLMHLMFFQCFLSIIFTFYRILVSRPAVVKQHEFNQALTIKKFYQNRNQFVPSTHIKVEQQEPYVIVDRILTPSKTKGDSPKNTKQQFQMDKIDEEEEEGLFNKSEDKQSSDERDQISKIVFNQDEQDCINSEAQPSRIYDQQSFNGKYNI